MNNQQFDLLDHITIASFLLSLLNYGENIDQSAIEGTVGTAVQNIHAHLEQQDTKIDEIIRRLEDIK